MHGSHKGRALRKQVQRALAEEGARDIKLSVTGRGLQRLDFTIDGFAGHFTFTSTPGGVRVEQNACSAARRAVRATKTQGLKSSSTLDSIHSRWKAKPGSRLAELRAEAHRALDCHWEFGQRSRSEAYSWLAERMGLTREECHIGMFGEKDCERVIRICRTEGPTHTKK